ncbi:N-alpha-acetyltransferase 40 [Condylostylus longicornis]|uniref:N-alpha-acetyltransferase 40 n=1 Tax=Condylostylus longicornis TaxID=2530218 RepID=UPI00244DCACA|nr:N-alpha-acetyltransferase 40 [Condylostylus longicornis]
MDISSSSQQKFIEMASKAKNPMEKFDDSMKFEKDGQTFNLICKSKCDVDPKILKWAFKLAERNVGLYYKTCSMGWQPKIKQRDLNKNWAKYLIAFDKRKTPIAYSMFRFDHDYGKKVLYCYEMQIEQDFRRIGLGRFMMAALEKCAEFWNMEKVVLTVLRNNYDAKAFFSKLDYKLDETSPDDNEKVDYEILSKVL